MLSSSSAAHRLSSSSLSPLEEIRLSESQCWLGDDRSAHQADSFVLVQRKELQLTLEIVLKNVSSIRWECSFEQLVDEAEEQGHRSFFHFVDGDENIGIKMLEQDSLEEIPLRCSELVFAPRSNGMFPIFIHTRE